MTQQIVAPVIDEPTPEPATASIEALRADPYFREFCSIVADLARDAVMAALAEYRSGQGE